MKELHQDFIAKPEEVLLQLLAFGAVEIEQGRFRSAEDVFADLDQKDE